MTLRSQIDVSEVEAQHSVFLAGSITAAKLLNRMSGEGAEAFVTKCVGREVVRKLLGGPRNSCVDVTGAPADGCSYSKWLLHLWGRRCLYYVGQLSRGLKAASGLDPQAVSGDILQGTRRASEELAAAFSPEGKPEKDFHDSLRERADVANFHKTYLDPILFSSLYYLQVSGTDLGDEAQPLWDKVREEMDLYTRRGEDRSGVLADDSTIWWGFVMLLRHDGSRFRLGRRPGGHFKFRGYAGARKFCSFLIKLSRRKVIYPRAQDAMREATFETHGEIRTRLFIALNAVAILSADEFMRTDTDGVLRRELEELVQLNFHMVCVRQHEVREHIYFLGLALEVSCAIRGYLRALLQSAEANSRSTGELTPQVARVYELLKALPPGEGLTGTEIIQSLRRNHIELAQSTLTTHIVPVLRNLGLRNTRGIGYHLHDGEPESGGLSQAQ